MLSDDGEAMRARVLIYAAVPDERMLEQGFYAAEAEGLRADPDIAEVRVTNRLATVARGDYDGLVSFFYSHSALATLLARLRGRPSVVTGGGEQLFPELAGSRLRYLVRAAAFQATALFASRILATSTSDLARMQEIVRFGRARLMLSYHGAPAVEHVEGIGDITERPAGSFITICGLDTPLNVRRKGIPEALELVARVSVECPSAALTIIGRTTCRAMVEDQARSLGLGDRVRFAGYVDEDEKLALLHTHRYYLQLSVYEGFGIGALEALSQGCQIIHSGAGGLADTVADFGVVVTRDAIGDFSLAALPPYAGLRDPRLVRHLERFRPATRAAAIRQALFGQATVERTGTFAKALGR